jgi:hypothetical protein
MSDLLYLNPRTFRLPIPVRGGGEAPPKVFSLSPVFLLIREAAVVLPTCAALFVAGGLA